MRDFYAGEVFLDSWIDSAIQNHNGDLSSIGGNKMMNTKDDHFLINNDRENCKKLNIGKKKQFTIVEGIKLF